MKHLDEYRDESVCRRLVDEIRRVATQRWTLMEVCGGQTHSLLRYGIVTRLARVVDLIHGPGCPVCVTPAAAIDFAIELSRRPDVLLTSFGDMLRVPGSRSSLLRARAEWGNVRFVYSPLDAVRLARRHRDQHVVFLAVGFETTAPATALAVQQAERLELDNFSLLVAHVRVQPAMELLAAAPATKIDGFLAAGHVCTITGHATYDEFVRRFQRPIVVTGFEPVDLLAGILACVECLEAGEPAVVNRYGRTVERGGNREAQRLIDEVYEVSDADWRGMGIVPGGGLRLRPFMSRFDASKRFAPARPSLDVLPDAAPCRAGEVLVGRIKPSECECFADRCAPDSPLGAPMVSNEGACAAYYRYARGASAD